MRRAQEGLLRASQLLRDASTRQASAQGAQGPGQAAGPHAPAEGEVVDAEFAEVDDKKP
jgi:hypothetical protein